MDSEDPAARGRALRQLFESRTASGPGLRQFALATAVARLEARLAAYTGAQHCVTVGSGAEALLLAMTVLQIGPGDEVITTPFAPPASVRAIRLRGAAPVFADIDRATCNLDPSLVEASITPRTRAIVPVSLYGQPSDMEALNAIGRRHGLAVVEDASDSFGATYHGNRSGNLAALGCTSFAADKLFGCEGGGGALFTRDEALAQAARNVRAAGLPGCRRMEPQLCASLLAMLDGLESELAQRQRVAASFEALFAGRLQRVGRQRDRTSVFAHYTLMVEDRERVLAELAAAGIAATVHPSPLHLQSAYANCCDPARYPVATGLAARVLSLPIDSQLGEASATKIATAVLRSAGVAIPPLDQWSLAGP
ncbi:MAG: DegT/DnrJ/EryC1/StrS family aminotransferase [Massilia sp.]